MKSTQVNSIACKGKGNLISWESMVEEGITVRSVQIFPECANGNYVLLCSIGFRNSISFLMTPSLSAGYKGLASTVF